MSVDNYPALSDFKPPLVKKEKNTMSPTINKISSFYWMRCHVTATIMIQEIGVA